MSLNSGIGPETPEGMTLTIYTEMDNQLSPPLKKAISDAKSSDEQKAAENALKNARENWKKLSYSIAKGIIEHLKSNMEIFGIQTQGNISAAVSGDTRMAAPNNHLHSVSLSGVQNNVVFTQSNDGTGRVR